MSPDIHAHIVWETVLITFHVRFLEMPRPHCNDGRAGLWWTHSWAESGLGLGRVSPRNFYHPLFQTDPLSLPLLAQTHPGMQWCMSSHPQVKPLLPVAKLSSRSESFFYSTVLEEDNHSISHSLGKWWTVILWIGKETSKDNSEMWQQQALSKNSAAKKWKISTSSKNSMFQRRAVCFCHELVCPCEGRRKILRKDAAAKKWKLFASSKSLHVLVKVGERNSQPIKLPSYLCWIAQL